MIASICGSRDSYCSVLLPFEMISSSAMVLFTSDISNGFLFEYFKGGVPNQHHHLVQSAAFLFAVFTSFIEVQAHAGQQGNGAVQQPYYFCHGHLRWRYGKI